jgi:hypothetical protein
MPTFDAHRNFALTTVVGVPSPPQTGASLTVASGEGASLPTPPFNMTVWAANQAPTVGNAEIIRVTAIVGDTLTILRAQEGSSARQVVVGDLAMAGITAKTFTDIENLIAIGGSSSVTFTSGGNFYSNVVTVTHNRGGLGYNVSLTPSIATGNATVSLAVLNKTANTFDVQGVMSAKQNLTLTFDWVLVGP